MEIIASISLSGGQGKTTTTLFLSLLLACKHRVLVVDADPQANLTFFLGVEPQPNQPTLLEVLRGDVEAEDGIYPTQIENLFLMPADSGLSTVVEFLSGSGAGAFVLKMRLAAVEDLFDYVLIDVQPSRSQIALTAMGAANLVLIPVETTTKGVNSLLDTLNFIERQKSLMAFTGKILGVVPFRDRWVGHNQTLDSRDSIEAMRQIAQNLHFFPSIRESEQFKQAMRSCTLSPLKQGELNYPFEQIATTLAQLQEQPKTLELKH